MLNRRREALWEYSHGALWVLPGIAVVLALVVGALLSNFDVPSDSPLHRLVFQGTADDARDLLIGIAGTVITVIALMLGQTMVALQLSSTQFSPRILRNFLRDIHNQLVLSVFVATFAYSMAGLYTVGVSAGERTDEFPRLAVTGAILMLFLSLGALVYEVHHISHSMQIDEIMRKVERTTRNVIREGYSVAAQELPPVPAHAVTVPATHSGYVQTIHAGPLIDIASADGIEVRICEPVGQHVVAGVPLAWVWTATGPPGDIDLLTSAVAEAVRIGFERTLEQDAAFGVRQLVDIASKALSPAINDPYTAVQAIDHLAVIVTSLARRELNSVVTKAGPAGSITIPALSFAGYLDLACAQIRRYGAAEPIVAQAQIALLRAAATAVTVDVAARKAAMAEQLRRIMTDSERGIYHPADFERVRVDGLALLEELTGVGQEWTSGVGARNE